MASLGRVCRIALFALGAVLAAVPVHAGEPQYGEFKFPDALHRWSVNGWTVSALPGSLCVAIVHTPLGPPNNFWGFKVVNGLDVTMIFGPVDNARPQTVQIEYNDEQAISYPAIVDTTTGSDGYAVPIKLEDLWAFTDDLFFDAYASGDKVSWGGTKVMGKVALALEKCDNWQSAH
jgi:hypothetical protein